VQPTPAQLRALSRRDPLLGRALRRLPPFPGFPQKGVADSRFHALARAIVYQQLSGKAAATIHGRVAALGGRGRFPRPEQFAALSDEDLRGAGLSRAKVAALRDLAQRVCDGRLALGRLGRLPDDEVIEHLVEVRGIGRWSAEMFLMFHLGRLDVMPVGDLGVQEGLRLLEGRESRPTPAEVAQRALPWRPLCSVASWVLWRVVDEARAARP
jgi:DNA-3-methyladenine glycosylase II